MNSKKKKVIISGDQLFAFFTQLGVANVLDRVPVLNVFNDSEFVHRLSKLSVKFPTVLEQFMIVIEPVRLEI